MGIRRKSRESAMQALFSMDMNPSSLEELLSNFFNIYPVSQKALPFFLEIVKGVTHSKSEIDTIIERFSNNWKVSRMSGVDRNILRIAVYELFFCEDIPSKVSINEAIDIGKKFGTEESGAFINGILDTIHIAIKETGIELNTEIQSAQEKDQEIESDSFTKKDITESRSQKNKTHSEIKIKEGLVRRRPLNR